MKHAEIEPQMRRNILKLAVAYAEAKKLKLATLSRQAHGDPPFFDRLKKDEAAYQKVGHRVDSRGSFTARVYDKLILWFDERWPADTEYPELDDLFHQPKGTKNGTHEGFTQSPKGRKGTSQAEGGQGEADAGGSGASGLLAKLKRGVGK